MSLTMRITHVDHNKGGDLPNTQRGGSDTMLKSNGPNSISKDALRDEDCPWLINCTTQEYLVNVGLDSHFNMPPHVWRTNQIRGP